MHVEHNKQKVCLPMIVMKARGGTFIARSELDRDNSNELAQWVNKLFSSNSLEELLTKYKDFLNADINVR
jgi:hypothetical protein